MKCPRCDYEWDVRQNPCPRCRLQIRVPGRMGPVSLVSPAQEALASDSVIPATVNDVQIQPAYPLELADREENQPRVNDLQPFTVPATRKLDPKKATALSQNGAPISGMQEPLFPARSFSSSVQPPLADMLLHRNRYSLQKKLHRQTWPAGIVETTWAAVDTLLTQSPVVIHELSLPGDAPQEAQAIPYIATKTFIAIGRNPHVPALRDVFNDNGRNYFVFEAIEGLSLSALMFNNGGKLPEREVVACCVQIAELLDVCSRQSPPLVHGNMRPEYILKRSTDAQYVLTNFSVALAGGLAEMMADTKGAEAIPVTTDGRADLSTLLEIAYYAVMGQQLPDMYTLEINSALSRPFHALLSKGLLGSPYQRYQNPAQLYHEMLLLYNKYTNSANSLPPLSVIPRQDVAPSAAPMAQVLKTENGGEEFVPPVPPVPHIELENILQVHLPDNLPPLKNVPDLRNAVLWFAGMLFVLVLLLGRGLI